MTLFEGLPYMQNHMLMLISSVYHIDKIYVIQKDEVTTGNIATPPFLQICHQHKLSAPFLTVPSAL